MKTVRRKINKKLAADGSGRRWDFLDRHRIWYINSYFFRINFWLGLAFQISLLKETVTNKSRSEQTTNYIAWDSPKIKKFILCPIKRAFISRKLCIYIYN